MATWAIGDVQGCHDELTRLIDKLRFDPAVDRLWFCGDLVNRGGQSLAVLRAVKAFGDRAIVALGNHDLSLLAIAERKREDQARVNPELREILFAPDRDELLAWMRRQKLVHVDRTLGFMLVHAGLFPRWTTQQAEEDLVVTGATPAQVGAAAFRAGLEIHGLAEEGGSLEEIFLSLTAGRGITDEVDPDEGPGRGSD
jgi:hypothetical protein